MPTRENEREALVNKDALAFRKICVCVGGTCLLVCLRTILGTIMQFYASRRLVEHRRSPRQDNVLVGIFWQFYVYLCVSFQYQHKYVFCICISKYGVVGGVAAFLGQFPSTCCETSPEVSAAFGGRGPVPRGDLGGHFQHPGGPVDPVVPGAL